MKAANKNVCEVSSSSLSSQEIRNMNSLLFENARKVMDSSILLKLNSEEVGVVT